MDATKTTENKKLFLELYEKNLGIISPTCKACGIDRTTYYRWRNTDEDFAEKCKEIEEMQIDFAESSLLKQIKEGNPTSTIFFLKTKGKGRGYVEKIIQETNLKFPDVDLELIGGDDE